VPPGILHRKTAEKGFTDACVFIKDFVPLSGYRIAQFEDDRNHTFKNLLLLAFDVQIKNEPNAKAIINSLGDVMYQLLVSWNSYGHKRNAQAEAFQNILLNNISNCNFDISAEIKKTGYCSSYFRKLFKEFSGHSPVHYLNHLRIEYSKKQLQQYHDVRTIKEIALGSGFSDPYYFSRVFKQYEGVSPEQYIKNLGSYNHELIAGVNYPDGI
jgi:AraC family transcriptional regulator, arabinose operon regulatory protein